MKIIIVSFFSIICALVGIYLIKSGSNQFLTASESKNWPKTEGVITDSRLIKKSDNDGITYEAQIAYQFYVEGEKIMGSNVQFGKYRTGDPSLASFQVNKYKSGKKVTVFYNPINVYKSVLEPGQTIGTFLTIIFGIVLTLMGGSLFVLGWQYKDLM